MRPESVFGRRSGRRPADRDTKERARELLTSGRLTVAFLDGAYVAAVCQEDRGVCDLGYEAGRGWWCGCDASPTCHHLVALRLVTERAVTRTGPAPATASPAVPASAAMPVLAATGGPSGEDGPKRTPEAIEGSHEMGARRTVGPGGRRTARWVLGLVLFAAGVAAVVWAAGRGLTTPSDEPILVTPIESHGPSDTPGVSPSATSSPSASATPSTSPSANPTFPTTTVVARFPDPAHGPDLQLHVRTIGGSSSDCVNHLYDGQAAYQTDCRSWKGHELAWFYVSVQNGSDRRISLDLKAFALVPTGGTTVRPTDVSEASSNPGAFFPRHVRIDPGKREAGWLTFRAGTSMVARTLSLVAEEQFLTVEFEGDYRTVRPG